ncbi:MAG: carotenoid oxygenase family protein [Pseudomonadota bacterium]
MKRREFLGAGLASLAASQIPVCLASEWVDSTYSGARDWRLGWQSVATRSYDPLRLEVTGKIPEALYGVLFRNGPAKTERADVRYRHWFDGDGMIQRFAISADGISHTGRFVDTEKFVEEEAAGRFLYSAAGTVVPNGKGSRNNDSGNVANTALLPWNGELLALWEGGSAYGVDPTTLATHGRKDWRSDLTHMPFSAHPLVDRDGTLWNFGSAPYAGSNGAIFVYEIAPDSTVRNAKAVPTLARSYAHSFLMTEQWLVIYLGAHLFEAGGDTFVDAFQWKPENGSHVLLINKNDLSQQHTIEVPPGFVFHGAHAFEQGDEIVARVSLYDDAGVMDSGMIALMDADAASYPEFSRAHLATLRINPKSGKASVEKTDTLMEFPGIDSRFVNASTPVFGVGHRDVSTPTISDAIIRVDPESGKEQRFAFPDHHIVEEPLFVAGERGNSGWLIGTYLNYETARSGVYILDAQNLAEGPVATAEMARALPLGFHGCFVGAA